MEKKQLTILIVLTMFFVFNTLANNLQINNVSMAGINTTDQYIMVKFDISWENSWRTSAAPFNWDAAWIFLKYRINGGEWQHATLSTIGSEYIAPTGSIIDPAPDGVGVFMYRSADGTGSNTWTDAQLRWDYVDNSVADNASAVEVKVLGIEMVYLPQGAFYAGDNATSNACFKQGSADNDPWYVGSENAISVTNGMGSGTGVGTSNPEYYYVSGSRPDEELTGAAFSIPYAFPKGYKAFYCMKYETSQGQYTEFLNMLTRTQQAARVASNISNDGVTNIYVLSNTTTAANRNTIVCPSSGNGTTIPIIFSTLTPDIACNFLSWADGAAYTDWTGLRPMTELEFEKACRGTLSAVNGEYAWGNTLVKNTAYILSNSGAPNEVVDNHLTDGNAAYYATGNSIAGPLRTGIFANSGSARITSGAGYTGVMELSGNLWERPVTVGNSTGRSFAGNNGNGVLTGGDADELTWPGTSSAGSGFRGGNWDYVSFYLRTSDRFSAALTLNIRHYYFGFRGVRCQ